jgi:hypothetical protein
VAPSWPSPPPQGMSAAGDIWLARTCIPRQTHSVTEPPSGGARTADEPSGLSGAGYARNNRSTATRDDNVAGRWVAVDESGWDGEQLYARADRYLSIGSVAIDDGSAAAIVDKLRQDTALKQPPELKFSQFTGQRSGRRLEALAGLIERPGVLAELAHVYLVDKQLLRDREDH